MADTLTGVLDRIVFHNEENHFIIGEVKAKDHRGAITVLGNLPGVQCGETLKLTGDWTNHATHGKQFKIKEFSSELPASVYGIEKYLGSGQIPKVGPKFAKKIVAKFGADTLRVISEESGRLREIPGVGPKRAKEIKKAWDEQASLRDVMTFLQTYGVGTNLCLRLIRQYGNAAKTILQNEPYRVAREVPGIGFKTADRIAVNLGYSNESSQRIDAGLLYALQELEVDGHTGYPVSELTKKASEMLEVHEDLIGPRVGALIENSHLVKTTAADGEDFIQLPAMRRAEVAIAQAIAELTEATSTLPPIKIDKAIEWAQERAGFQFAPEQSAAVAAGLRCKVSILTGGPGTGKTTILRALVDILKAKKVRLTLAAPTGRAAQRMSESAGAYAQTIHRLLKFDHEAGGFLHTDDNKLKTDFMIVDESSMLDSRLASSLLRALPDSAHLLLVGDIHQLPSVGAGSVLSDIIAFIEERQRAQMSVTRLEKIFRQGKRSAIVSTAHAILQGRAQAPFVLTNVNDVDPKQDLHFLSVDDPEETLKLVTSLIRDHVPRWFNWADKFMDVQVLAPMHKGAGGVGRMNEELPNALNAQSRGITYGANKYRIGDKVIQTRNNYEKGVFNGDLGRVNAVNVEAGTVAVNFDGDVVDYERPELLDLSLAYAITIHKSQGSEFPIVIVPLLKQHFVMLQRNLLYTAITRGRRKVFLVGDPAAYAMAVRNVDSLRRLTGLKERLKEILSA
ncbi:SF1B family DNA helicase RecD2 [Cerasicoccus fimbriatus]|uniref:SF1B family DNA helicase RecD2 n=1 Tax=Cerasicoccus fimbriatus TaxID=3014554 RepID=UPI0022B41EC8|nr:ATP-dependent RecD-like DNA helicase [Cerasicoccus sp. TK19100]